MIQRYSQRKNAATRSDTNHHEHDTEKREQDPVDDEKTAAER